MRRILDLLLFGFVVFFAARYYLTQYRGGLDHAVTVEITPGNSFAVAASRLEAAHVAPALPLRFLARLEKRESHLQAGALIFPAHETIAEALDHLTVKAERLSVWVTVPEGYTAAQIEQRLLDAHLAGAHGFSAYAHHTRAHIGTVKTASLEGYLYPDTYLFNRDAKTSELAQAMVAEFRRYLPHDAQQQAHHLGYTLPQVVTIASLIEREAQAAAERPLMAGVYYHRLAISMPLEVDASLEYPLVHHETELKLSDLRRDTPYNTYLHAGLPPTPIANPGLASLMAALHPLTTSYLYYVYKGGGRHAFAETYAEHKANITRYLR